MSLSMAIRRFLESCSRKKSARMQPPAQFAREAAVSSAATANLRVWSGPVMPAMSAHPEESAGMKAATGLLDPPAFMEDASPIRHLADVPGDLRDRIQQEGMARSLRRLETPLRALYMATSRKGTQYPAEELRGFLLMWRQALTDYMGLVADERSVIVYDRSVDEAYFVRGRCEVGAHLTVLEPCWRLNGEVVVRGEAQVVQGWVR